MPNPYNTPPAPRAPDSRPLRKRKRIWLGSIALVALGAFGGTQSANDVATSAQALSAKPAPTVTITATATQTAKPEPAPTVTKTRTVKTPGPTVTVTKAAQAAGSSNSHGSSASSGKCSIVSNAGNCYQAGQFCRNSDHGALTTTASGARIKCTYSANAWRWTYS
ncbi:hypothetical protein ACFYRJ_38590 [Streptomyces sp. NPDC005531]|uniref:hypothetical protein n=1 Tax=Streptomyces sp. NPDC005531 TaxID=3364722 RepID=UPI0036BC5DF9